MSIQPVVVLCMVLVSVQLAAGARRDSPLALLTQHTESSLTSLSPRCSQLVRAEESRLTERLRSCAWGHLVLYFSELLTDTAYFGFGLYNHGVTIFSDIKDCWNEKYKWEKAICVLVKSPGAIKAELELLTGAISYALQLKDLIPDVITDIKQCRNSTVTEYQLFLDNVVETKGRC